MPIKEMIEPQDTKVTLMEILMQTASMVEVELVEVEKDGVSMVEKT